MHAEMISFLAKLPNTKGVPDWAVALCFFGPLLTGIAYLIYTQSAEAKWKKGVFPKDLPFTPRNYLDAHVCLAAYFLQRDRREVRAKFKFLRSYFQRKFKVENFDFKESIEYSYEYPITPSSVAQWLMSHNSNKDTREELLVFLIQLCVIDGLIVNKEYVLLKQVAQILGFEEPKFQELLAAYSPKKEQVKPKAPNSVSLRARFSEILGISTNANKAEVKKAYRNLAKKYHPDRFVHANEATRQENQAKFIAVQEAYDYLYNLI